MRHDTHTQRVLDLLSKKGMPRPCDLDDIGAPRVVLTRMTANVNWRKLVNPLGAPALKLPY